MCKEVKEVYSDGIGKIHFIGGMIKLDMFSFEPTDNEDEKPTPQIIQRVIMSPNGFLSTYDAFCNMINKLTDAGVLAKQPASSEDQTVTEETTETIEDKATE